MRRAGPPRDCLGDGGQRSLLKRWARPLTHSFSAVPPAGSAGLSCEEAQAGSSGEHDGGAGPAPAGPGSEAGATFRGCPVLSRAA